jgi:hypothetical protein
MIFGVNTPCASGTSLSPVTNRTSRATSSRLRQWSNRPASLALTTLSAIPLDSRLGPPRQLLAVSIMLAQIIGAVNSVRFGVSVNWRMAGAYVLCYVIVSMLLADLAGVFLQ